MLSSKPVPIISLVLPTYNQAHFLPQALDGIIGQTFKDFELIIVNDGSTDKTNDVLNNYRDKIDFILIEQKNQGLPRALNAGFAIARGKYFSWTSSDNITHPKMLEVLYGTLECNPHIGVAYADWYFVDESGRVISLYKTLDFDRHLLLYQNIVHCCFLFRRECMERVGLYDPEYIYGEDWEFWIRVSRQFKMIHVPQPLYDYRIHPLSMTTETLEGTARYQKNYGDFIARIRRETPIDYWMSKIKWKIKVIKLGYDPRAEWHKAIWSYTPTGQG